MGASACDPGMDHREAAIRVFCSDVEFNPIAGRYDHRLLDPLGFGKLSRIVGQLAIRDGETLPQVDGGGMMTESKAKDLHRVGSERSFLREKLNAPECYQH